MMDRKTVVLDPGHGGTSPAGGSTPNRGIAANGLFEKDVALDLATRIKSRLRSDFTVVLTRENDRNLTLADRAAAARRVAADMFVSIHFSGSPGQISSATNVVTARQPNAASSQLASSMQRNVGRVTGAPGGVVEADLGQLAGQRHAPGTAACLVEVASLDDAILADRLTDSAYLDRLAEAFATSVREAALTPATTQWVGALGLARSGTGRNYAQASAVLIPQVDYSVTNLGEATRIWIDWFRRYGNWYAGVPDSAVMYFPHGAICQLVLTNTSGTGTAYGTGFYIANEVILTCGHNFFLPSRSWQTGQVEVQPGFSPTASTYATKRFTVNAQDVVHPRWWSSNGSDNGYDLAVLPVPGLPAPAGTFSLANMSMEPSTMVVVSGYGKDPSWGSFASQPQRMDGATIARVDPEIAYYPIQTLPGHSGSPLFYESMVIGVHRAGYSEYENQAALLTPDKNDWIVRKAGGGVAIGLSRAASGGRVLTVTRDSSHREQPDELRPCPTTRSESSAGRSPSPVRVHGSGTPLFKMMASQALAQAGVFGQNPEGFLFVTTDQMVPGIDVSHHNGAIDWARVAQAGVRFAYIKATEGATGRDARFAVNWREARANGIPRGAYHLLRERSSSTPETQARNFTATVQHAAGDMPPAIDIEFENLERIINQEGITHAAEYIEQFWQLIETATGYQPLLYMSRRGANSLNYNLGGLPALDLWMPIYRVIDMNNLPPLPQLADGNLAWPMWSIWQHSETGQVDGIQGNVDMNLFNGNEANFQTWLADVQP